MTVQQLAGMKDAVPSCMKGAKTEFIAKPENLNEHRHKKID